MTDWIQEGIRWNAGYISIIINGKAMKEYRYIWECYNGKIPIGKIIHHKDCNVANNNIDNLQLTDVKEHRTLHKIIRQNHSNK